MNRKYFLNYHYIVKYHCTRKKMKCVWLKVVKRKSFRHNNKSSILKRKLTAKFSFIVLNHSLKIYFYTERMKHLFIPILYQKGSEEKYHEYFAWIMKKNRVLIFCSKSESEENAFILIYLGIFKRSKFTYVTVKARFVEEF